MQADPSAQNALLTIAELDKQITQLTHKRSSLPENEELVKLQAVRSGYSEQIVAAETRRGDADFEMERIEKDLAPARARIERNRATIDAGTIDPKALAAMIEETEHLTGRISDLEDAELEAMESIEALDAQIASLKKQRTEVETTMRSLLGARDASAKTIDTQLAQVRERRGTLVTTLPTDLVALYERIASRSTTGAAELKTRRCGGCGMELGISELKRISTMAPAEVVRCEECSRILVRTAESGL
ncbi:hypothetical protein HMPREF1531_01826 [Propionibacterium sp. oral taxon 192 str. F0372]|uniref:zinc ribbon domain-containing protein n=1 Tax=Propionibacterium sp. oral taxon 192 TaxID=671222 RepID=UPI0003527E48|nr:C4-type zinc ribbon domain-containing protein [Propionibacterium sp. oral taxon 192]EPH02518.1 hypothetical protein HMPREF1531_01826 [Propionibacterium sp. oral taxon 192 str. F0372]